MKNIIVNHNREKLLNLITYFVKNTKKCYKTKLFKLLYFADFLHFRETGKSITGLCYEAWKRGPVPCDLYFEIKKPKDDFKENIGISGIDERCKFIPKKKFDDRFFTKRELRILEKVAFIFKDADADLMVESSHLRNEPWHKTIQSKGQGAKIDYELAFDGSPSSLPAEKYKELLENNRLIQEVFS